MGGGRVSAASTAGVVKQALMWANQNRMVYAILVGSTLVMYGFYRSSVRIMHFFFNVSDKQVFNIGFALGALAAVAISGAGLYTQRYFTVDTGQVYRAALAKLRTHGAVEKALGDIWRPSGFRGYKVESLRDAVQGSDRRARSTYLEAPSRRVQMIFTVKGVERTGLVSLEAHKRMGSYRFDMLALDVHDAGPDKPAEHIFLDGSADRVLFSEVGMMLDGVRRSGLEYGRKEASSMGDDDGED